MRIDRKLALGRLFLDAVAIGLQPVEQPGEGLAPDRAVIVGLGPGGSQQPPQTFGARGGILHPAAQQEPVIDRAQPVFPRRMVGRGKEQLEGRLDHLSAVVEPAFVHEGQQRVQDRRGGVEHLVEKHHLGALHLPLFEPFERGGLVHQLGQVEKSKQLRGFGELGQQIFEIALVAFACAFGRGRGVLRIAGILRQDPGQAAKRPDQPRFGGAGRADHHHRLARHRRQHHAAHGLFHAVKAAVQLGFEGEQPDERFAVGGVKGGDGGG